MSFGDDLYGWGVSRIPMPREPRTGGPAVSGAEPLPGMWRDFPWRSGGSSILLSLLSLLGILLLDRISPQSPSPVPPKPVEVAVRMFEEAQALPPPQTVEIQEAPVEEKPAAIPEPPPKTAEIVPPGSPPVQVSSRPSEEPPALPRKKTRVAARQETSATVLPEPSLPSYEQRTDAPASGLPKRTAVLRKEDAPDEPASGPRWSPAAERGTEAAALPERSAISLAPSEEIGSNVAAPRLNARYENIDDSPAVPSALPHRRTEGIGGSQEGIPLPKGAVFATVAAREEVAMLPSDGQTEEISLVGAGGHPEGGLPGPAVRTASLPRSGPAPSSSGKSFDFLDSMGQADLDPSFLVSLNRLRTCLDPDEELALRSRLAAMLGGPQLCRSGGVVFDIRHPESAYSVQIDLYNYEQRAFPDRCAALRLAVLSCEARR